MPTAAKLIAAVLFGALTFFVSDLVKPLLPEGSQVGLLSPINALFGLIMGWRISGARAGDGYVPSLGYGLTSVFAITFWCILVWAGYEMTINSINLRFDGPIEALQAMAGYMVDYARMIGVQAIVLPMVIGGLVCGWITEYFSHRWS